MERIIIRINDAAEMLCTSPNKIKQLLEEGKLPAYRDGRNWSIPIESVRKYAEDRAEKEAERRRKDWILNLR